MAEASELELLRRIVELLEALPRDLATAVAEESRRARNSVLTLPDRRRASMLLPALEGTVGLLHNFSVRYLVTEPALRATILPIFGDLTSRQIGKFLARVEGCVVADRYLQAAGELKNGRLWRLNRISAVMQTRANPETRPAVDTAPTRMLKARRQEVV